MRKESVKEILKSGVYYLWDGDICVYIGQSENIYRRLFAHRENKSVPGGKKFDKYSYVEIDGGLNDREKFEYQEINKIRPKYNKRIIPQRGTGHTEYRMMLICNTLFRATGVKNRYRLTCMNMSKEERVERISKSYGVEKDVVVAMEGLKNSELDKIRIKSLSLPELIHLFKKK